jgi:hypothetical protein
VGRKGPGASAETERAEREHPRYAHEAAIHVRVAGKTYEGRSSNISRGGLCADMPEAVAVGTVVDVAMQLVFDEDTASEALALKARVVWCTTLDETYQLGLSFMSLDAQRIEYLTMFLRYLDDGSNRATPKLRDQPLDDRFR